ncbi:MAG: tyrosine-protein phosphatase [Rhodomicrobium sp.]
MFDLHSHLLPGIDDGAPDLETSLAMARAFVEQGVECVACTPHILPGLYYNTGPQIRQAVAELQSRLEEAGIPLKLVSGADNHIVPDFVDGLKRGHLLTLADSAYVLAEPPHHVAPARLEELFFNILLAGYVPVLTHPERLSWIENKYDVVQRLAAHGVWMQITSGSLTGRFGRRPRYWAERMLEEGIVQILATDAHNMGPRPPDLLEGRKRAEQLVGPAEALHLVTTRPQGVLTNSLPGTLPKPSPGAAKEELHGNDNPAQTSNRSARGGLGQRMWRLFN